MSLFTASPPPRKRHRARSETSDQHGFDPDWLDSVTNRVANDKDKALFLASKVLNTCSITSKELERFRSGLPSFSATDLDHLRKYDLILPDDYYYPVPTKLSDVVYGLPNKLQRYCFRAAKLVMVSLSGLDGDTNEASRLRLFNAYWTPVVALFNGCLYDKPEHMLLGNKVTSGGRVEHELYFIGGILLLVAEMKKSVRPLDHAAQLFAEMLCAAELNHKSKYHQGLCVYGLLTDIHWFYFFEYDHKTHTFKLFAKISVREEGNAFLQDMAPVANKLFTVMFHAYFDALQASEARSKDGRYPHETFDDTSAPAEKSRAKPRPSLTKWNEAMRLAEEARKTFETPTSTLSQLDLNSTNALEFLKKSTESVPSRRPVQDPDDDEVVDKLLNVVSSGLLQSG